MFVVEGKYAKAEIKEQREIDAIIAGLAGDNLHPVLRRMVDGACRAASVDCGLLPTQVFLSERARYRSPGGDQGPIGDVFCGDTHIFLLVPSHSRLNAWEIRHHSAPSDLHMFCEMVTEVTKSALDGRRLRGMDFNWQSWKQRPERRIASRARLYPEVKLVTKDPDYAPTELQAVRLLVSREHREFVLRLAEAGGKARFSDATTQTDPAFVQPLIDVGILRKEFLILCKQDSHTICATQDCSQLDDVRGQVYRCSTCGRAFKDEQIREIYALTDLGKRLLDGARWMTIWVTDLLIRGGIEREAIAWNVTAGEDELDIMTDALGCRVFFELKDRQFGLGDAYPFASRVPRYGGLFGAVLTTDVVANEAKRYFEEQRPGMGASIEVIEGPEGIENALPMLVDRISRTGVHQLVSELFDSVGFNFTPLLRAWMDRVTTSLAA